MKSLFNKELLLVIALLLGALLIARVLWGNATVEEGPERALSPAASAYNKHVSVQLYMLGYQVNKVSCKRTETRDVSLCKTNEGDWLCTPKERVDPYTPWFRYDCERKE
jgi:hypothetical protein